MYYTLENKKNPLDFTAESVLQSMYEYELYFEKSAYQMVVPQLVAVNIGYLQFDSRHTLAGGQYDL